MSNCSVGPLCLIFYKKTYLEVGRSLLLDLVGQGVDLEAVEAGNKLVGRSLWPEQEIVNQTDLKICSLPDRHGQNTPALRMHDESKHQILNKHPKNWETALWGKVRLFLKERLY